MNIHGFITLTLLDYPEHLAASVFLGSCNLRCPFCQNGNLVLSPEKEAVFSKESVSAAVNLRCIANCRILYQKSKLLDIL